jgi:shikimate kinase / 3-dehydroquinate synthase
MSDLILTGFMGTGKTTVGGILADRFGVEFVDTDDEIERRAGCTVAEFWARNGEPAFRELEAETFREIMHVPSPPGPLSHAGRGGDARIIATGAGTLVSEHNRARLRSDDIVISLACGVEALRARLESERAHRPLLAGLAAGDVGGYIGERLAGRQHVYDLFQQVETTGRTPEEVAGEIAEIADLSTFSLAFDAGRSSKIVFGRCVSRDLGTLLARQGIEGNLLAVTDGRVGELERVRSALSSLTGSQDSPPALVVLPEGEEHKTLASAQKIYRAAKEAELDRSSAIVAIGGGVIGDVAGLAAATYMRGVRLVLVPTTLLAQVDAAIGGKVGVDFEGVKNLVGAFHPAEIVVVDPQLLHSLSDSALADGLAEIVKIGMVFSKDLLCASAALMGVRDILSAPAIIRRAATLKVRVVEADPYERGDRALLNFGHTIGHAAESASGYRLSHGQAIAAGMVAETWLAVKLGLVDRDALSVLTGTLQRFGLPVRAPGVDRDAAWDSLQSDKKRLRGAIRFALPSGQGSGALREVSAADARAALDFAIVDKGDM